jgi:hypothetical protein
MLPRATSGAICIGLVMIAASAAWASTLIPNLDPLSPDPSESGIVSSPPTMIRQGAAGPRCTIAVIVENATTSDTYLSRMSFPAPDASAGQVSVCPPGAAEAATQRALDACKLRAANREDCTFADTDHMFDISTDVVDSSALDSQCFSYKSKFIGVACGPGSHQDNCNIGCGDTAAAAIAAARTRCRANHGGDCAKVNAAPVQAP